MNVWDKFYAGKYFKVISDKLGNFTKDKTYIIENNGVVLDDDGDEIPFYGFVLKKNFVILLDENERPLEMLTEKQRSYICSLMYTLRKRHISYRNFLGYSKKHAILYIKYLLERLKE